MKIATKQIVVLSLLATLLFVLQVALGFLPNIEVVSLLIIIYTLLYERKTLYIIYVFALLEGIFYGFGIWWIMYLYVWTILYTIVRICRKNKSLILWAIINAFFGLSFGALCAIPYALAGGLGAGLSWWASGILFDIIHAIGNFAVTLILFKPIHNIIQKTKDISA